MELLPIITDNKEVITAGNVISFGENPIEMTLTMFKEPPIPKLEFSFLNNDEGIVKIETLVTDKRDRLNIKIYNVSSIDSGNLDEMEIGMQDGKKIYLNFRVKKIGNFYSVDYSFYKDL